MEVYPEKYEQLELTANEKSFLRTMNRTFDSEDLCYYVLHINPRKIDVGGGKPELFNLLVFEDGVLLFRFIDAINENIVKVTIEAMSNVGVFDKVCNDIYDLMSRSRYLTNEADELNFAYNVCLVFPNIEQEQVFPILNIEAQGFCNKHVIFADKIQEIRKEGKTTLRKYLNRKNYVEEKIVNNIFQRLCPEITIPQKYRLNNSEKTTMIDSPLDSTDRSVLSFRLDSSQINFVNRIKKGDQLILACAGSGKSVLLISKCFKLASLNPCEKFLITCYNRNLKDYYQWSIAQAGFLNLNVKCQTFFALLKALLDNNQISSPSQPQNGGDQTAYFDKLFEIANDALAKGRIKERFTGIFIDEIQIFKPEWYRFCFNLLKNQDPNNHYFVIAGDKSQDIKSNIKSGKAPWQGGGSKYPEYRGKTLPIEINYRNSKPINDAVDKFVENAKIFGSRIGADLTSDPELFLRGKAYRSGSKPDLIELCDYSNEGEARAICDVVNNLINTRNLSEVDIAIVLYNRRGQRPSESWKNRYYDLLPCIRKEFERRNWDEPDVLIAGESDGTTYGSRRSVTITTIEGSLGLDFRAIILAGLCPLGKRERARSASDFNYGTEAKSAAYKQCINLIYTGCTRAKDELSIVLSIRKGESVYMDLIRDSMGSN